jgi:hypothetical protein
LVVPTIDQESVAIDFVVFAWCLQLGSMEHLADVVGRCPVDDRCDIESKARECVAKGLDELNCHVADHTKMRGQTWSRIDAAEEINDPLRQRSQINAASNIARRCLANH